MTYRPVQVPALKDLSLMACVMSSSCMQALFVDHFVPRELEEEMIHTRQAWETYCLLRPVIKEESLWEAGLFCASKKNSCTLATLCFQMVHSFPKQEKIERISYPDALESFYVRDWAAIINHGIGLDIAFIEAVTQGNPEVVSVFLNAPLFCKKVAENRGSFLFSFRIAVNKGCGIIVFKILNSSLAACIPSDTSSGLGWALCQAAIFGHTEVACAILSSSQASRLPADERFSLGDALSYAAMQGRHEIVTALLNSSEASRILLTGEYGLEGAYRAAQRKWLAPIAEEILQELDRRRSKEENV